MTALQPTQRHTTTALCELLWWSAESPQELHVVRGWVQCQQRVESAGCPSFRGTCKSCDPDRASHVTNWRQATSSYKHHYSSNITFQANCCTLMCILSFEGVWLVWMDQKCLYLIITLVLLQWSALCLQAAFWCCSQSVTTPTPTPTGQNHTFNFLLLKVNMRFLCAHTLYSWEIFWPQMYKNCEEKQSARSYDPRSHAVYCGTKPRWMRWQEIVQSSAQ